MGFLKNVLTTMVHGKEISNLIAQNEKQFNAIISDSNAMVIKYSGSATQREFAFKKILKMVDDEIFKRFKWESKFMSPPEAAILKLSYLFQFGEETNNEVIVSQSGKAIERIREDFSDKIGPSISLEVRGKTGI